MTYGERLEAAVRAAGCNFPVRMAVLDGGPSIECLDVHLHATEGVLTISVDDTQDGGDVHMVGAYGDIEEAIKAFVLEIERVTGGFVVSLHEGN